MPLTDDELREVFARAEEIQRSSLPGGMSAEIEAVIGAGEEVGLARSAIERALRERQGFVASPPAVGSLVFARSADDKFHVAEVLSVSSDDIRVRFLQGSEHVVTLDQLRPCTFIPGGRIVCNWPWWGPWTCTVISYDAARRRVKVSDGWGSTETFPIGEVWLPPVRKTDSSRARRRVYATLLGAGAGLGALIGSILTAIVLG
jgi:hypothetical protein